MMFFLAGYMYLSHLTRTGIVSESASMDGLSSFEYSEENPKFIHI